MAGAVRKDNNRRQWLQRAALGLIGLAAATASAQEPEVPASQPRVAPYEIVDGAIPAPLAGKTGDPARGRAIVLDRAVGNCLICHQVPVPSEPFQGDLGPDLAGVGLRLSPGEIRLTLVDRTRVNPDTLMPPYHRVRDLRRVAPRFRGAPALTAQQVEDVVAWLASLTGQQAPDPQLSD